MTTSKNITLLLIFTIFALAACCNSNQTKITENITTFSDTFPVADSLVNATENDFSIIDNKYFPKIEDKTSVKVLTVGVFHNNEVWENADKEKWFGLFKNKNNFYVAETNLKIKKVYDEIVDEENEKTGWEVQTTNKDSSIILFEKINYLKKRKVEQAFISKNIIFPEDSLSINYLGVDYKIYATGGKKKVQDKPEWFEVWNYKLYVSSKIKGQERTSLLVAQPNFDDKMINLIFIGDIDGDGVLDLIIDTSSHYNVESPTIYLSTPAENGEIVKPIGKHTIVGC